MKNKISKPTETDVSEVNSLKLKLTSAVQKVLYENKSEFSDKIDKVVKKSIKKIVKKHS